MAIPSSYTESTLRDYMLSLTAGISSKLKLTASSFTEAVNDTLAACSLDDIADATDIRKLRHMAAVEAWRTVVNAAASSYDISRDSGEASVWDKENQLYTNAQKQLAAAIAKAESLGFNDALATSNLISFGTITYDDPYSVTEVTSEEYA